MAADDGDDYDVTSVDSDVIARLTSNDYRLELPSLKKGVAEWLAPPPIVEEAALDGGGGAAAGAAATGGGGAAAAADPWRGVPEWLRAAQEATAASPEFRHLCRELIWRVDQRGLEASFGALAAAEQAALLEDVYGQMVVDGSAGAFEALVCAQLDGGLSGAVTAQRLAAEANPAAAAAPDPGASLVDVIEGFASNGIVALLRGHQNFQDTFNMVQFERIRREGSARPRDLA
jgi:hypothetical protein